MTTVYGELDWYRERPELEEAFNGVLQRRQVDAGPAARTALRYSLVTDGGLLAVYAPDFVETLEPFIGHRVVVLGKLVDFSSEGSGAEVWIGSIGLVDPDR